MKQVRNFLLATAAFLGMAAAFIPAQGMAGNGSERGTADRNTYYTLTLKTRFLELEPGIQGNVVYRIQVRGINQFDDRAGEKVVSTAELYDAVYAQCQKIGFTPEACSKMEIEHDSYYDRIGAVQDKPQVQTQAPQRQWQKR